VFVGAPFIVVYDASVLFPAPVRDALMRVAVKGLVQAKWTEAIHEEWISGVLGTRKDVERAKLERTRDKMNAAIPDCLVTDYEDLIPALTLPDPDDCHILAAAIKAGAQTIVTGNIKHFPDKTLNGYGIAAERPDEFLVGLVDINEGLVAQALREQWTALQNPPLTKAQFLENLERHGLVQTVAAIRDHM
jgi:predicted nucleic acid-binding protein